MAKTHLDGQLRVWHNSNLLEKSFYRYVAGVDEAIRVLDVLSYYDLKLGDSVEWNAQGCEVWEDEEWIEFYDEEGCSIAELRKTAKQAVEPGAAPDAVRRR